MQKDAFVAWIKVLFEHLAGGSKYIREGVNQLLRYAFQISRR